MAVKIRLKKLGHAHNAFYRVVVADSHYPRNGRFIEEIGYYNPYKEPSEGKIDADACKKWLANGAQPTEVVAKLFKIAGISR
jgi:small subunit ribosomal protein S16